MASNVSSSLAWKVLIFRDGTQYGSMGPYLGAGAEKDARADARELLRGKSPGVTAEVVKTHWNPAKVVHYAQSSNPGSGIIYTLSDFNKLVKEGTEPLSLQPSSGYFHGGENIYFRDVYGREFMFKVGEFSPGELAKMASSIEDLEYRDGDLFDATGDFGPSERTKWADYMIARQRLIKRCQDIPPALPRPNAGVPRRKNHHLKVGERAKYSTNLTDYNPRLRRFEMTVVEVLEDGYLVQVDGYEHARPTRVGDRDVVSADSTTLRWPGDHYEGLSPLGNPTANPTMLDSESTPTLEGLDVEVMHEVGHGQAVVKLLVEPDYLARLTSYITDKFFTADDIRRMYGYQNHFDESRTEHAPHLFALVDIDDIESDALENLRYNPDWKALAEKAKQLAESAVSAGKDGATRIKEEAQVVAAKARIAKVQSELSSLEKCAKSLGNVHRPQLPDRYEIEDGRLVPGITEFHLMGGLKPGPKEGYEGLYEKREQLVDAQTTLKQLQESVAAARQERKK